jgi:uncharacterized protein DUF6949
MRVWEAPIRVSLAHAIFKKNGPDPWLGAAPRFSGLALMSPDSHFLRELTVLLFAVTSGLTLSGIIANIYRILARKPEGQGQTILYYGVMVLAGASVLLENATRTYRKKDCSAPAYGFAIAIVGYWCFIMGLGILTVALSV